jgi:predicted benzoate:H+ symporter BenE
MRTHVFPFTTLLAGFVAVLVGYASSAAIIWQAAAAAGASATQIAGWMTALGLGMGVSTIALSLWYRMPILTAWSTPGAALLATSLQGLTLAEAIGVFIFANALIVLCGVTGLFARLMKIIPHTLAAAMLAGILLRFGLQAFHNVEGHFVLCGSMLLAWLVCKALAPRYAIVATLIIGALVAWLSGDIVMRNWTLPLWCRNLPVRSSTGPRLSVSAYPFSRHDGVTKCARLRDNAGGGLPCGVSPLIILPEGWRCFSRRLGFSLSASPPLRRQFVKARMRTPTPHSAGRLRWRRVYSIC